MAPEKLVLRHYLRLADHLKLAAYTLDTPLYTCTTYATSIMGYGLSCHVVRHLVRIIPELARILNEMRQTDSLAKSVIILAKLGDIGGDIR